MGYVHLTRTTDPGLKDISEKIPLIDKFGFHRKIFERDE